MCVRKHVPASVSIQMKLRVHACVQTGAKCKYYYDLNGCCNA